MALFRKKSPPAPDYPPEEYEPVLRCSICTGEQTACLRRRRDGKLLEIMLIRSDEDLRRFCRKFRAEPDTLRKVY